jgi:xanthine dehydrogenase accessory factor
MIAVIRGGGDLASGVALRLVRAGICVVITELPQPLAIRRTVSFADAVYTASTVVEGVTAQRIDDPKDLQLIQETLADGRIPVLVDPQANVLSILHPEVVVDARMLKQQILTPVVNTCFFVGLGPGFTVGENCHAVIETQRSHTLGRVIWTGSSNPDTGIPEGVAGKISERVLRAPTTGVLSAYAEIGMSLQAGQPVAAVAGQTVFAPFAGVLRGLLHPGLTVELAMKIGDVDPRNDPRLCELVSDKALAVGGGVLEAILSQEKLRNLIGR